LFILSTVASIYKKETSTFTLGILLLAHQVSTRNSLKPRRSNWFYSLNWVTIFFCEVPNLGHLCAFV